MLRNLLKLIQNKDAVQPVLPQPVDIKTGKPTVDYPSPAEPTQPSQRPLDRATSPSGDDDDSEMIAGKINESGIVQINAQAVPPANHRAWLLSKHLTHIKICSPKRCEQFANQGVLTAGDLAKVDAEQLATQLHAPESAVRSIQRYSAAIRLAASVPGMMPRDAQILIRIHRHSTRAIAMDSPSTLYQDLQRFAHSSSGQRVVGSRRLPSMRKIKRWITSCRDQHNTDQSTRAAA